MTKVTRKSKNKKLNSFYDMSWVILEYELILIPKLSDEA